VGTVCTALSFVEAGVNSSLFTKTNTQVQVATDVNFTAIVYDALDIGNNTNISIPGLADGTNYFIRLRYDVQDIGLSNWSNTITFTTQSGGVLVFDSFTEVAKTNLINHTADTGQTWGEGDWGLNSIAPDTLKLEVNPDGTSTVLEYSNGDVPGTDTPYSSQHSTKSVSWLNYLVPVYNYYIEANVDIVSVADDSYVTLIGRIQSAPGTGTAEYVDINWWPSPSWAPGASLINDSNWGSGILSIDNNVINQTFTGLHLFRIEFNNTECKVLIDGILRATVTIDTSVIIPGGGGYVGFGIGARTENFDSPGIKVLDFKVDAL
jgi:hypothetical protein